MRSRFESYYKKHPTRILAGAALIVTLFAGYEAHELKPTVKSDRVAVTKTNPRNKYEEAIAHSKLASDRTKQLTADVLLPLGGIATIGLATYSLIGRQRGGDNQQYNEAIDPEGEIEKDEDRQLEDVV